jgi:hypothetical protein
MYFKGTIIITDPCYLDIENVEDKLEGLFEETGYGDWSCTTFKDTPEATALYNDYSREYLTFFTAYNFGPQSPEEKEVMLNEYMEKHQAFIHSEAVLGQFCADGGMVCVALLDDVMKLNPEFSYDEESHWITVIPNFEGDVVIDWDDSTDSSKVIGKGNINFYTAQTGL